MNVQAGNTSGLSGGTDSSLSRRGSASAKVPQTAALTLATLSISLAALTFAASAATQLQLSIPRPLLSFVALMLVYAAALDIDWVVDSFTREDWKFIFPDNWREVIGEDTPDPKDPNAPILEVYMDDQQKARMNLYNGGYFALSAFVGLLNLALLWLNVYSMQGAHQVVMILSWVLPIVTTLAVIYQMNSYVGNSTGVFRVYWVLNIVVLGLAWYYTP
jgi:hypothetical protein